MWSRAWRGSNLAAGVLLAAHYDSVPAGPGASDDGVGTAVVLEIARALKSLPRNRHSIILLIDDGEEAGLLGARAFVKTHRWAKDVRAAVNLDARGTSGPSLMFETGTANEWAVRLYANHVAHPATSSIFYTAYQRLPNDTDFTVFKAAGFQGLNFAFIGDPTHYHTPLDNVANVSPRSVQHHGENALPMVVTLANANLNNIPLGEAVFFDLFGRRILVIGARRARVLAAASALLVLLQMAWLIWNGRLSFEEYRLGILGSFSIIIATTLLGLILVWLIRLAGAIPSELDCPWASHRAGILVAGHSRGHHLFSFHFSPRKFLGILGRCLDLLVSALHNDCSASQRNQLYRPTAFDCGCTRGRAVLREQAQDVGCFSTTREHIADAGSGYGGNRTRPPAL